ncbi:MAG TPA: hypothetical protein VET30_08135 [Pseudoxanthomonas sp.]|nr:hypothetical protein [Pseudoxanthomonas sp.]
MIAVTRLSARVNFDLPGKREASLLFDDQRFFTSIAIVIVIVIVIVMSVVRDRRREVVP